jgi:L-seryl-tRNA(Ser) seleniumtransferase
MNTDVQTRLRQLPGVDKLLQNSKLKELAGNYGIQLVTFSAREILAEERKQILAGKQNRDIAKIIDLIEKKVKNIAQPSLKAVINATGIVLHTNLSRAPLGGSCLQKIGPVISGYSNLEFNLNTGRRGQRNDHISELLRYITGAENALVVNNNAAAVYLSLITFAQGSEVIISRGELIEIGGSFRIPDIMQLSGATMIEVGTTNRTRLEDYETAITAKTRIIFKAHKSNYEIKGFSEEVETEKLAELAHKHGLIMVYDIGSGLLRKPAGLPLENEPDVQSSINAGADLVSFSGDKLLGGPQAGIIAGRDELVKKLAKSPLMRALRVGKLTMAVLQHAVSSYLDDANLIKNIPVFAMLSRSSEELYEIASRLQKALLEKGVTTEIIASKAQVGGGTLPGLQVDSWGVQLINQGKDRKYAQKIFTRLLELDKPVLGILREGNLIFDVLSLFDSEIQPLSTALAEIINH